MQQNGALNSTPSWVTVFWGEHVPNKEDDAGGQTNKAWIKSGMTQHTSYQFNIMLPKHTYTGQSPKEILQTIYMPLSNHEEYIIYIILKACHTQPVSGTQIVITFMNI